MPTPRLQLTGITKHYPSIIANDGVNLTVMPGEIHAILGENGAGKSTLMKMIYGVTAPDAGLIHWNGQPCTIPNPQIARQMGIGMVFQHFSLFETLTVAENIWLGLEKGLSLEQVRHNITTKATEYGLPIEPNRMLHTLSVGEMQRVEIIRALLASPQLLILDEPTSVLTPQAVETLFTVLRQLSASGCSILYISHKLHEIRALCHACTVMRAGKVVSTCDPQQETNASLSKRMIGNEPPPLRQRKPISGAITLKINNLSLPTTEAFGVDLQHIDLHVCSGELVGIAGVSGNGQREFLRVLSGEDMRLQKRSEPFLQFHPSNPSGSSEHTSTSLHLHQLNAVQRRALGVHFVPEERLGRGAVPSLTLAENLLLTRQEPLGRMGWIRRKPLRQMAQTIIQQFGVKCRDETSIAQSLSGGNLQKFIMGREISAEPRLLLVSQPTWGVDVGASAQIRERLLQLREAGCAILVVSEELDELFELCDRLYVMARGQLSPSLDRAEASPRLVGEWMSGLWKESTHVTA